MTPAEHYAEAEELLGQAWNARPDLMLEQSYLAYAQVHATLATCDPTLVPEVA